MEHALMDLLESGDIDAIRRRLKKVEQGAKKEWLAGDQEAARKILSSDWTQVDDDDTADKRPAVKKIVPKKPAPSLFSDRPLLKLSIGDYTLSLRSYRTMGKLLWPAGHAVALMLSKSCGRSNAGATDASGIARLARFCEEKLLSRGSAASASERRKPRSASRCEVLT